MAHKKGKGFTGMNHKDESKQAIREKMKNTLNAEYWTAELVEDTLFQMLDFLNEEYEVKVKTKKKSGVKGDFSFEEVQDETIKRRHHTKTTLLQKFQILNHAWFYDMAIKFKEHESISEMLELLTKICENNVYTDAANGAVNAGVCALLLQSEHKWTSRHESKNENKDISVNVEIPEPDEEAKKRWEASQLKDDE